MVYLLFLFHVSDHPCITLTYFQIYMITKKVTA